MATRKSSFKSGSKSKLKLKLKPVKTKVSKTAPAKKAIDKPAPQSAQSTPAEFVSAVLASTVKQKIKLVRDSFAMPKNEYISLSDLKLRSARLGQPAKKSEILRAGVAALSKMSDAVFSSALAAIPSLKTGRPKDAKTVDTKKTTKKS